MDRQAVAGELVSIAEVLTAAVPKTLWHLSNARFRKFDPRMGAQGILWFSKDRDDLLRDRHGANLRTSVPVYLYEVRTTAKNPAGWEEYNKLMLSQLRQQGYDSIDLGEDVAILDPRKVKTVSVEEVQL